MEVREPILMCVTGAKGVGKTYTSIEMMMKYVRPNANTGKVGRKILIYDINQEYTQFKTLQPKDIIKYSRQEKVEIRRILPLDENGNPLGMDDQVEMLKHIIKTFRGGLLLLEDINKYVIQVAHVREVIGFIATNRHLDLDIIIHYQSLRPLDPRMWQNTTFIRFHFQTDNISDYKKKIPNYEMTKIAQCIVNYRYHKKKDKRFYLMVALLDNYITGDYNVEDFVEGCKAYFTENQAVINRMKRNFGNNFDAAQDYKIKELMHMYYRGNM